MTVASLVQARLACRRSSVDPPGEQTTVVQSHFRVPVPAADAGESAAKWFSELTGERCRLVAMIGACGWRLPDDLDMFGQNAPFSDAAPILLTARAIAGMASRTG